MYTPLSHHERELSSSFSCGITHRDACIQTGNKRRAVVHMLHIREQESNRERAPVVMDEHGRMCVLMRCSSTTA